MNLINFLDISKTCNEIASGTIGDVIRIVYNGVKIGVPIILIIVGMFDMGKAISQQKEDEIKKAQSLLVKKAVAAVIVFLMFNAVQILVGAVGGDSSCMDAILNNKPVCKNGETFTSAHCEDATYTTKESCEGASKKWVQAACN